MEEAKPYKTLVNDLRFCAEEFKNMPRLGHLCETMSEAADAIEDLTNALTSVCSVLVKYRQQNSED